MEILERFDEILAADSKAFTLLEFGACDGYHTKQFLDKLTATKRPFVFHAFEPVAANFNIAQANTWGYSGHIGTNTFELWRAAVGDSIGMRKFYVSGGKDYYGSSSIRAPKEVLTAYPDMTFTETNVAVTTLDAFTSGRAIVGIDFIWADIQGAEVDLIRGGMHALKTTRYLYTEYCDGELYEGEIGLKEILKMLPDFEVVEDYGGDVLLKNRLLT